MASSDRHKAQKGRQRQSHAFDVDGFFDRLLQAMAQADVTQAELGRRIGRGQATISEWFSKRSLPSGDTMAALPPALGVSYEWLFFARGPRHPVGATTDEAFIAGVDATIGVLGGYLPTLRDQLAGMRKGAQEGASGGKSQPAAAAASQRPPAERGVDRVSEAARAAEDVRRTDHVAARSAAPRKTAKVRRLSQS